jgi:ribosomal protein S12 methylthiotransferase accessory factor
MPLARVLDCLVDDRTGILSAVSETRTAPGAPPFFHYVAYPCNTEAFSEYPTSGPRGAAAADRERAATRVITDAVAAYCAALISEEDGKHAVSSMRAALFRCVAPADFVLFSEEQDAREVCPWAPFTEHTSVQWSEAFDPLSDESLFIPSALRFLPYEPMTQYGEAAIAPATSTGLACHWNRAAAAIEALCDVVECDALAAAWHSRKALPQLRIETLSDANYDLVTRFERTGGSVTLFRASAGKVAHTVLAVLSSREPSAPARVFAAGTALDAEEAVRASLEMLAHTQQYCQLVRTQYPPVNGVEAVVTQADHLNYWSRHENAPGADFLFASRERIELDELESLASGDPRADLEAMLRRVREAGRRALLAELTTPDVADLGLSVFRALIPGLLPIFYGQATQPRGARNPLPHPFPRRGMS